MDFFNLAWDAAQKAGPFASLLLLIALYVVNAERKACLSKKDDVTERLFGAMHDASDAIKDLRELFYRSGNDLGKRRRTPGGNQ